jgi:hypothetical protein
LYCADESDGERANRPDLTVIIGAQEEQRYDDEQSENEVLLEKPDYIKKSLHREL